MGMDHLIKEEEVNELKKVIKKLKPVPISIAKLAKLAGQNPNRTRYVLEYMLNRDMLAKVPVKDYGRFHRRYYYKLN